jgi:NitT/TauT family transport system substrate-binding protein
LQQLKNLRLGYEASSVAEVMLAEILKRASLLRQDVKLVKILVDDQLAAWQAQHVDALITYEPVATQLTNQGMVHLFDSQQMPDTVVDVLAVRRDALDASHAKALRHLIASHFRALDHLTRNPQDAAYRLAARLNLPPSEVLGAFKGLILPTPANNYRLLAGDQPQLQPIAKRVADILHNAGLVAQRDDLANLIDGSYLPKEGLLQ